MDAIPAPERKVGFRFESRIHQEASKALQALGYYNPRIDIHMLESGEDELVVQVQVDKGEPTILSEVDIKLLGDADQDKAFQKLLETAPKRGDILDQGQYDQIKSAIQDLAVRRGYFNAEYVRSSLEISPTLNRAFIYLYFDSGQRYKFGDVFYHNSQIEQSRLNSMMDFKVGEPYLVSDLGAFNQALSNTGWFSSVLVEPELSKLHDGKVPVVVTLEPADRNKFETGLGISTDTGPRIKLGWDRPWFNSRGHALSTELYLSSAKQTLESNYKIPLLNAEQEYYQVQFGLENQEFEFTRSLDFTASVSRHWKFDTGWQRIAYIRWLYADFVQFDHKSVSNLLLPGINFSRVRSRGGAMPHWGDKQSATLEVADPVWGSDLHLTRLYGESMWIRSLNEDNRFITRLTAGALFTDAPEKVPPSLRFFAGGDNSIRGYSYQSISPKDENNSLIGGNYITTASLEYNYRVTGDWWAAFFVDGGDAWSDYKPEWKNAAGIGVRWESPVGPVRFDIAHGFDNPKNNFTIHFGLGPEL